MKRADLFHPRVFNEKKWAEGYYKRNARNIARTGKRFSGILKDGGFSGGRVLDAGCGFAAVPIELAKAFPGTEIIGIDLGEPLLGIGEKLVNEAGLTGKISLFKGDVQKLKYEDNSFDLVVCSYMLHIVDDPVNMLNEIERVAKPEGKIMITDLRRGLLANFIKKFRTSYTLEEALEVIQRSDLRDGKTSKGPFWWDYTAGV